MCGGRGDFLGVLWSGRDVTSVSSSSPELSMIGGVMYPSLVGSSLGITGMESILLRSGSRRIGCLGGYCICLGEELEGERVGGSVHE